MGREGHGVDAFGALPFNGGRDFDGIVSRETPILGLHVVALPNTLRIAPVFDRCALQRDDAGIIMFAFSAYDLNSDHNEFMVGSRLFLPVVKLDDFAILQCFKGDVGVVFDPIESLANFPTNRSHR